MRKLLYTRSLSAFFSFLILYRSLSFSPYMYVLLFFHFAIIMFRFALFVVSFDGLLLLVRDVKPTHLLKKQNNDRNEKKK